MSHNVREALAFVGQLLVIIAVVVAFILCVWGLGTLLTNAEQSQSGQQRQVGYDKGYSEGYCAALGGAALNADTCNVEGKVVAIVR